MEHHRFHLLDALRGLAALVVVFYHAPAYLNFDLPFGFLAVDFFFCLSGFVIAFSYEERLRSGLGPGRFILLRIIRLYPLYFLATILTLMRMPFIHARWDAVHRHPGPFAALVTMALLFVPNFTFPAKPFNFLYPFNAPAWSLFYELAANLLFAFVIVRRYAMILLALAASAGLGWMALLAIRFRTLNLGDVASGFAGGSARVAFSFSAGFFIYRAVRRTPWRLRGKPAGVACVVLGVSLCMMLSLSLPWNVAVLYELLFVLLLSPALVYAGSLVSVPRSLVRLSVFLGEVSYPIYMLHLCFSFGKDNAAFRNFVLAHPHLGLLAYVSSVAGIVVISDLAVRFFDAPVRQRLASALRQRTSAQQAVY